METISPVNDIRRIFGRHFHLGKGVDTKGDLGSHVLEVREDKERRIAGRECADEGRRKKKGERDTGKSHFVCHHSLCMSLFRLSGGEEGLIGYWGFNEGPNNGTSSPSFVSLIFLCFLSFFLAPLSFVGVSSLSFISLFRSYRQRCARRKSQQTGRTHCQRTYVRATTLQTSNRPLQSGEVEERRDREQ